MENDDAVDGEAGHKCAHLCQLCNFGNLDSRNGDGDLPP